MISKEERVSRLEGIIEQINERLGSIESRLGLIERNISMLMDRKADKTEVRFLFGITITLICVLIGLVGGILARV
jgi:tetrahydromethanopterin S-methyltransferase subunit G